MNEIARRYLKKLYDRVIPVQWVDRSSLEVAKFIKFAAGKVKVNDKILDIGAGRSPWRNAFTQANYVSLDLVSDRLFPLDIVGNATAIPVMNSFIDAILCLSVLEHVREPYAVLEECFRVLAPSGQLFITVPFGMGLHMRPYDYYRFSEYGLRYLLEKDGFTVVFIKPMTGHFTFIGEQFRIVALELSRKHPIRDLPFLVLLGVVIPGICFFADKLDKEERFSRCYRTSTLEYCCYCVKPT